MAKFNSSLTSNIGIIETTLYTCPANNKAILVGCNAANITGATLPISIIMHRSNTSSYIVKNKRVDAATNEELQKGNKLVLLSGDTLSAISGDDNGFDVIISVLEGIS